MKAAGVSALPRVVTIHSIDSKFAQLFWVDFVIDPGAQRLWCYVQHTWSVVFLSAISAHSCRAELIHLTDKYIKGSVSKAINIFCGGAVYALQEVFC